MRDLIVDGWVARAWEKSSGTSARNLLIIRATLCSIMQYISSPVNFKVYYTRICHLIIAFCVPSVWCETRNKERWFL